LAISEEQIRDILEDILVHPLALFSFKIKKSSSSTVLDIVLDHLADKTGSASLDDCEKVSRDLVGRLEEIDPEADFQIKVQSAGAERKLRLPEDLGRFIGLLANLELELEPGKSSFGVYRILEVRGDKILLEPFHGKGKSKKNQGVLETEWKKVKKGNLYIHI
jgi:ribosome maturation factor RimP